MWMEPNRSKYQIIGMAKPPVTVIKNYEYLGKFETAAPQVSAHQDL